MVRRLGGFAVLLGLVTIIVYTSQAASASVSVEERPLFTRLVGPHTLFFMHNRIADTLKVPAWQALYEKFPEGKAQLESMTKELLGLKNSDIDTVSMYIDQLTFENGQPKEIRPPYFMIQTTGPIDAAAVKASVGKGAETIKFGKYEMTVSKQRGVALLNDRTILVIMLDREPSAEMVQKQWLLHFTMLDTPLEVPAHLKASIELAVSNKHHVIAAFALSKELSDMAQEQAKSLPATMSPFKPLAKIQSGIITVDYQGDDQKLSIRARFEDAGSAKAGMGAVRFAIAAGKLAISSIPNLKEADMKLVADFAKKQLDQIKTEANESELTISHEINMGTMMGLLLPAIEKMRASANYIVSANNMKQLLIGMHNFHNDYGYMPPVWTSKEGKPLHSWRVQLLPYVEEDQLYKKIKLEEPWDSEHNKKLFESTEMPKVFAHPLSKDATNKKTVYKVFYSKAGAKPTAGFQLDKKMSLAKFFDGTSNTICLIEAGPPVLWYQPDDIEFDAAGAFPALKSPWPNNRVNVAFFDGSVRALWLGQDEDVWKAGVTADGGEAVDLTKLEQKK